MNAAELITLTYWHLLAAMLNLTWRDTFTPQKTLNWQAWHTVCHTNVYILLRKYSHSKHWP